MKRRDVFPSTPASAARAEALARRGERRPDTGRWPGSGA